MLTQRPPIYVRGLPEPRFPTATPQLSFKGTGAELGALDSAEMSAHVSTQPTPRPVTSPAPRAGSFTPNLQALGAEEASHPGLPHARQLCKAAPRLSVRTPGGACEHG